LKQAGQRQNRQLDVLTLAPSPLWLLFGFRLSASAAAGFSAGVRRMERILAQPMTWLILEMFVTGWIINACVDKLERQRAEGKKTNTAETEHGG
jgi:hypothetical protein